MGMGDKGTRGKQADMTIHSATLPQGFRGLNPMHFLQNSFNFHRKDTDMTEAKNETHVYKRRQVSRVQVTNFHVHKRPTRPSGRLKKAAEAPQAPRKMDSKID